MNDIKQEYRCDICNKAFSTKGNLVQHIKNNKKCLWARDINTNPECNFCNTKLTKTNYEEHVKNCKFKVKVSALLEENQKLKEENKLQKEKNLLLEEQIKSLTKFNNIPYLPLTQKYILETTQNTVKDLNFAIILGSKELGIYAGNFIFRDRVFCSSTSRYTVQFIEENSNRRIIDTGCKLLTKKFIESTSIIMKDNIVQIMKGKENKRLEDEYNYLGKIFENLQEIMVAIDTYKNGEVPTEFQRKFAAGVCSVVKSFKYLRQKISEN